MNWYQLAKRHAARRQGDAGSVHLQIRLFAFSVPTSNHRQTAAAGIENKSRWEITGCLHHSCIERPFFFFKKMVPLVDTYLFSSFFPPIFSCTILLVWSVRQQPVASSVSVRSAEGNSPAFTTPKAMFKHLAHFWLDHTINVMQADIQVLHAPRRRQYMEYLEVYRH